MDFFLVAAMYSACIIFFIRVSPWFVSALLGLVSTPALGADKPTFVASWVMALLPAGCPFNRARSFFCPDSLRSNTYQHHFISTASSSTAGLAFRLSSAPAPLPDWGVRSIERQAIGPRAVPPVLRGKKSDSEQSCVCCQLLTSK
jgi:hypothetical protein